MEINTKEREYRAILLESSSSLKDFATDRKKFHRKYILNETIEEKDKLSSVMGRLVETLLLEPELFDEKFYLSAIAKTPTGKMLDFVNALVDLTISCTDENGEYKSSFEDRAIEARAIAEFDWSLKVILEKFSGKDPEIYFKEMLKIKQNNLTLVTANDIMNAEKIVEGLKTSEFTSPVVNLVSSKRWEVFNQYPISGYNVDGITFKSLLDKLIVDNEQKNIYIYDLKCTWNVENFYEDYYLYRKAYIQAYLYMRAVESLVMDEKNKWFGYTVKPISFIVCDSSNYYAPLIYQTSRGVLEDAYNGFEYKGETYVGVKKLIEDLNWAYDNNIWNISRANYMSHGLVKLAE